MGWVMEKTPEAHMKCVKNRLEVGHSVLEHLGSVTTYNIKNVKSNVSRRFSATKQASTLPRMSVTLTHFSEAGSMFLAELLEIEDGRGFCILSTLASVGSSTLRHERIGKMLFVGIWFNTGDFSSILSNYRRFLLVLILVLLFFHFIEHLALARKNLINLMLNLLLIPVCLWANLSQVWNTGTKTISGKHLSNI
jgi:hypothetical protein